MLTRIAIATGKILLLAVLFIVGVSALTIGATQGFGPTFADSNTLDGFLFQGFVQFAAALFAAAILVALLERRSPAALGLAPRSVAFDALLGFVLGALTFAIVIALAVFMGVARYAPRLEQFSVETLAILGLAIIFFAATEEILIRGYVLHELRRRFSFAAAALVSSLIFAALHAPTLLVAPLGIIGVVNIVLAGIWFSLAVLRSGGLWLPIGLHVGWNFAEGPLLGSALSGHEANRYWTVFEWNGPDWLTGGNFGPEASVLTTVALGIGTSIVLMLPQRALSSPPSASSAA